ncbi:hypothetical protein M501DRAFT_997157 [Patellaria atrata CBS 101060]|uniref:FAS1 domain-containing protein n=1 Tax=Patellaria atrata CBS 101060 TaxID=1346257 RepID=A0A9P4S654_9PEZI|nr:hypothetical protein M501DRAFT_997157 [Patellaria atrata CBS 101060]
MRPAQVIYSLLSSCLVVSVSARPDFISPIWNRAARAIQKPIDMQENQAPIMDDRPMERPCGKPAMPDASSDATISDVIGKNQNIGIFSGFTRDIDSISSRLEDASQNATVLAPENSAIMALPRKPWEDPRDYETLGANAYHGQDGEDRAHKNLRRFVEAHIVPESPWNSGHKLQTLVGSTVWFLEKDGKKYIQPGEIEVISVKNKVSNGEVWVIKSALNYA